MLEMRRNLCPPRYESSAMIDLSEDFGREKMIGHSEFPAASYDAWKTRSPDDDRYEDCDDYDPREDCDHGDYEVDFEGRAECSCGARWWLTPEQLDAHDKAEADFYATMEREERRERSPYWRAWRWLQSWFRWPRREPKPYLDINDEIPF